MSASKRIAIAVSISWVSRAIGILSSLLFMPILFRFMGKEELGLWFLLGNSQAFLGLLGMGIAPTLTRRIAFAKGKSGSNPDAELTEESKQDIGDWVVTGRIILQWLAVIIFFVAWISGYGLIRELKLEEVSPQTVFWAWTLMCLGYAINVWLAYLGCWLQGIGYIGWDSAIATGLSIITIAVNIVAVLMGGGILALAIISIVSGLSNRFIILSFIKWRQPHLLIIKGKWCKDYATSLIKPSLLWWLTDLGAFLILRTDAYFISILKGVDNLPLYQAGYNLVQNLYTISVSMAATSAVFISQAWQNQDLKLIQHLTLRNARIGLSLMAVGVGFVMSTGKNLVNIWLGEGNFIGYGVIGIFCIMLTLETQHVIFVYSGRATEDEVYAPWALTAGVLNVIFTWLLIKPFGLIGVALGTMFAQMLTNNWYAVYIPMQRLKINFNNYLKDVLSWWFILLLSSYCLTKLSQLLLDSLGLISNDWIVVITSTTVNGMLFLTFFWYKIISSHQQVSLISNAKMLLKFH